MQCGIAISPHTKLTTELRYMITNRLVDMILIMTVQPGFGGQSFIESALTKVRELRKLYHFLNIQVDGGINERTIRLVAEAGANVIVAGTSIFKSQDRAAVINNFRSVIS
uniref:Ribulose-phosphate 3-epimerase n=1 Tax=Lygus hesperus TaxID=30085 RepID=A0A0A9Y0E0_LYGHE